MDWDDYKFVLSVGRCAGLGAAARELAISHSTAHRKLEAIERALGVKLFERLSSGYTLTSEGRVIASAAEAIEANVLAAERQVVGTDQKLSGTIRVNTSELVGLYLFPEMLSRFVQQYPDVTVVTAISNDFASLTQSDADIVIRATSRPPLNLVGRRLASIPYCAYAHRDLAHRNAQKQLSAYEWIAYDNNDPQSPLSRWLREHASSNDCRIRFDSTAAVREAVSRGLGAAVLPCFTGDQMTDVVRISEVKYEPNFHLWLLTHKDLRRNARVRAFMKFMATLLQSSPYMSEAHFSIGRSRD